MARLAEIIKDVTGSLDYAFYLSGAILTGAVILVRITNKSKLVWSGVIK